jgi:hypothetical protein
MKYLFIGEKCEVLCCGRWLKCGDVMRLHHFVAYSISPSDDGCLSLNINACQNGALCRQHI